MPEPIQRISIEEVDWKGLLPWVRLFRCFRMAVHPPKMLLALLLVVVLYSGGRLLDAIAGPLVAVEETKDYVLHLSTPATDYRGIFATALDAEVQSFEGLINAATSLDFGMRELMTGRTPPSASVAGALREMIIVAPRWLYHRHLVFSLIYCVYGMMIWAWLAGAIARMAALEATRGERLPTAKALRFASARWFWYFATPLAPLVLVMVIGLLMAGMGWLLFSWRGLQIVGAFPFVLLALGGGLVIALILIGLLAGANMLYPALAVEGADAFDALTRVFNYALGRPWRWVFYNVLALVYGAVTYLFLGAIIFLTLMVTHGFVGWWVTRTNAHGANRFQAVWPPPEFGKLRFVVDQTAMDWSEKITAGAIWIWVFLIIGVGAAYAVNYYLCSHTWIYLLLRKAADGTDFDDVYLPKADQHDAGAEAVEAAKASATPDEVEPS